MPGESSGLLPKENRQQSCAPGTEMKTRFPLLSAALLALYPPSAAPMALAAGLKANPFGLMLGATRLSVDRRIDLTKKLGAVYFRPNAVFVQNGRGVCQECEAASKANLKLVLTVRNDGGAGVPSSPPSNLKVYKETIGRILDRYQPALLVVENEENSQLFYTGTPEQYVVELEAACEVAHRRNIPCTNGGPVSQLVALLVYNHYLETGQKAKAASFADRVLKPGRRRMVSSARAREQVEVGRALLGAYKTAGIDYLNFHWYVGDPGALQETTAYLRGQTGLPLITNEIGQHDLDAETTRRLMSKVVELDLAIAVWFSVDARRARALMEPDGSLRSTGLAFMTFIEEHFPF